MRSIKRLLPFLALIVLGTGLQASPALASSSQDAIFQDDGLLHADPVGTLATLRSLGVNRVRVGVYWSKIAPAAGSRHRPKGFKAVDPASYPAANWSIFDKIVKQAQADGISVYFLLTGPAPLWATGSGAPRGGPYGQWKPSAPEFGAFVRALGTRYSGSYTPPGSSAPLPLVSFWSIWNEPNYGPDLAPQATNNDTVEVGAAEYRGLVDSAWSALQGTHHGRDTILIGETAPRGLDHPIGDFSGVKPLRFLRALYCVDSRYRQLRGSAASARGCPTTASGSARFRAAHPALFEASGYAQHPYAQGVAPNKPTYACGHTTCTNSANQSDPDYADLPEIGRLETVLDRLQRSYGSRTRFPIYNTEYGYWTKPPDPAAKIGPATAALYMNWAEYLSWRQPRLVGYMQYLLVDPPRGNFASGLEFNSGAHKVTFDAYRMPIFLPVTSGRRGHALEVWGCVRPAGFARLDTGTAQQVKIQFQRGSRGSFQTVKTVTITNQRNYFDVRQPVSTGGSIRLAWTDPSGATLHSRTVTVAIH